MARSRTVAPQLVPLDVWAESIYGDAAPGLNTLRRWAREGRTAPMPRKHGRAYFVEPTARCVELMTRRRLIDRLR